MNFSSSIMRTYLKINDVFELRNNYEFNLHLNQTLTIERVGAIKLVCKKKIPTAKTNI